MVSRSLAAADQLADDGISAEVVDLRSLRPLDDRAMIESVGRTHRALVVDEGWRSGGINAEVAMRIVEGAFFELDAPIGRVCTEEVPIPYAKHLEEAAIPSVERIVAGAHRVIG